MRKLTNIMLALLVASALLSGTSLAQQARKFDGSNTAIVARIDVERSTILFLDEQRGEFQVVVDAHTRLLRGSEILVLSDLQPRDRVVVDFRRELDGFREGQALVADQIVVVVDPPETEARSAKPGEPLR